MYRRSRVYSAYSTNQGTFGHKLASNHLHQIALLVNSPLLISEICARLPISYAPVHDHIHPHNYQEHHHPRTPFNIVLYSTVAQSRKDLILC